MEYWTLTGLSLVVLVAVLFQTHRKEWYKSEWHRQEAVALSEVGLTTVLMLLWPIAFGALVGWKFVAANPVVHSRLGQAEVTWRSLDAYLTMTVADVWDAVQSSDEMTLEQRVALRGATTHVIRTCAEVVDEAYNIYGSDVIYESLTLQRRFQDMHVITQHVQGRIAHYEAVGRHAVGVRPDMMWL